MTDEGSETRNDQGAKEKRSRRAVLAGALGVVAAEVALRATPAEANDNDTVLLGTQNSLIGVSGASASFWAVGSTRT